MKKRLYTVIPALILLFSHPGSFLYADEASAQADMLFATVEIPVADSINEIDSDYSVESLLVSASEETVLTAESENISITDSMEEMALCEETEMLDEADSSDMVFAENDDLENYEIIPDGIAAETEQEEIDPEDSAIITEDYGQEYLSAAEDAITVNADEVTLYYLSGYYPDYISSIPENIPTSYQIEVSGTVSTPVFKAVGSVAKVDDNGLITLPEGHGYRNTPGEVKVIIDGETVASIKVNPACYEQYYAEQKVNADIEKLGIKNLDNDYDKVKSICEYISSTYNYSTKSSSMTGEVITGGATCIGNSDLVCYMCDQCGIPSSIRNANFAPGAGAGHENNIIKIGEDYYIVDCGYTGNAPRYYDFYVVPSKYEYARNSDGTICLESSMQFDSDIITIPAQINGYKVSSIRTGMLQERSYSQILVEEGSDYFSSRNGALCSADGKTLIACPRKTAGSYTIPDGVETVDKEAFIYCEDITRITMPNSLISIEEHAFTWCKSLSEVNWSSSLVNIGEDAFTACGSLKNIIFPESLRTIGAGSFCASMQPLYVYIPSGVTSIGADAFLNVPFMVVKAQDLELGERALGQCRIFCYPGSTVDSTCGGEHFDIGLLDDSNRLILQKAFFTVDQSERIYNGCEQKATVKATEDYRWLSGRDNYDITYQNNVNAGTATVLITGKNWCTGSVTYTFKISPQALFSSDYYRCRMQFKDTGRRTATYEYTGEEILPEIDIVHYGDVVTTYQNGKDYTLTYSNNISIGNETGTVTLNGMGNYSGTDTIYFTIRGPLPEPDAIENQQYSGKPVTPAVVIPGLKQNTDYHVSYWDNDSPGKASVTVTGLGCYEGTRTLYFSINGELPPIYYDIPDQKYTGSEIMPHVYIPGLEEGTDYTLSYSDNVEAGTATVTATGTGYYSGTQTAFFTIIAPDSGSGTESASSSQLGTDTGSGSDTGSNTGTGSTSSYHEGFLNEGDENDEKFYEYWNPTIKLNAYSIPLKVGQSTNKVKATGLKKWDSIWFWTSSNTKVATVNQKGVIKAGKKTGTAYVTVWTEYGAYATVKVTVQKKRVTARKISVIRSVTLKKGESYSLNAVASPFTATDKIKYKSSKKKVATVSGKGIIKAKKKGKTTITVSCGKKKVKVKVRVK